MDDGNNDPNPENATFPEKKHVRNKVLNGIIIVLIIPAFIGFLFYGSFVKIKLFGNDYLQVNLSLIIIAAYFLLQSILAIINNAHFIPKMKSKCSQLPEVSIQIIGRREKQ